MRLTHCYLITSKIIDNVGESKKWDQPNRVQCFIVAVAANDSSPDTFWFILISESEKDDSDVRDGYGNIIPAGSPYITVYYLERAKYPNIYQTTKKHRLFYKESIVYPFVQAMYQPTKKGYFITDTEICKILKYVEFNNLASIF